MTDGGQIIGEFVFNIKHPASCHMSLCKLGLNRRMGNAEHIAFLVSGLDQSCVITRAAVDIEQAIELLSESVEIGGRR